MDAQADYVEIAALPVWRRGRFAAMTMALFGIAACAYIVTTDAKIFEAKMQNRRGSDLVAEPVAYKDLSQGRAAKAFVPEKDWSQVTSEGRLRCANAKRHVRYCVVTGDTSRGKLCIESCGLHGEDYEWCWTVWPGKEWDHCVAGAPTAAPTAAPTPAPTLARTAVNGFAFYGYGSCTTKGGSPHYYSTRCSELDTAGCANLCEHYEWCYFLVSGKTGCGGGHECLLYIYPDYISSGTYKFPYIRGFNIEPPVVMPAGGAPIFRNDHIVGTEPPK